MNVTEGYRETILNASGSQNLSTPVFSETLDKTINIFSVTILFITMISLGCTMEIAKIKGHLVKPKGVFIALLAQFGIMPLTAFCLTRLLALGPIATVTVLICGCCPGGSLSNIFSLAINGDMNLSIVMTTCSSVAALGMMPLLLYIFCRGINHLDAAVPYGRITTTLVLTLVPCAIGILINHYRPNYAALVKKVGLGILIASTVILCILAGLAVKDVSWMIFEADVLTVAALMPLVGFTLGFVMSFICRLSPQCCRTICMETGCQNIQLCVVILKVAFSVKDIGAMLLFPLVYITMQCAEALLLVLCYRCCQTFRSKAEGKGHSCPFVFAE